MANKIKPCVNEETGDCCLYFDPEADYCVQEPGKLTDEDVKKGCEFYTEY